MADRESSMVMIPQAKSIRDCNQCRVSESVINHLTFVDAQISLSSVCQRWNKIDFITLRSMKEMIIIGQVKVPPRGYSDRIRPNPTKSDQIQLNPTKSNWIQLNPTKPNRIWVASIHFFKANLKTILRKCVKNLSSLYLVSQSWIVVDITGWITYEHLNRHANSWVW